MDTLLPRPAQFELNAFCRNRGGCYRTVWSDLRHASRLVSKRTGEQFIFDQDWMACSLRQHVREGMLRKDLGRYQVLFEHRDSHGVVPAWLDKVRAEAIDAAVG